MSIWAAHVSTASSCRAPSSAGQSSANNNNNNANANYTHTEEDKRDIPAAAAAVVAKENKPVVSEPVKQLVQEPVREPVREPVEEAPQEPLEEEESEDVDVVVSNVAPPPAVTVTPAAVPTPEPKKASSSAFLNKLREAKTKPILNLEDDVDYSKLEVLPDLPEWAPSLQQTKLYKNYMRLRYEWQSRNPALELPKVQHAWYKDGKPCFDDPEVRQAEESGSAKMQAAMDQLKAAKEGRLPVVKVTHRMSLGDVTKSRVSADDTKRKEKGRAATLSKADKRTSLQIMKKRSEESLL